MMEIGNWQIDLYEDSQGVIVTATQDNHVFSSRWADTTKYRDEDGQLTQGGYVVLAKLAAKEADKRLRGGLKTGGK